MNIQTALRCCFLGILIFVVLGVMAIPATHGNQAKEIGKDHKRFYLSGSTLDVIEVLALSSIEKGTVKEVIIRYNMIRSELEADWLYNGQVIGHTPMPKGLNKSIRFTYNKSLPGSISVRFTGPKGQVQLTHVSVLLDLIKGKGDLVGKEEVDKQQKYNLLSQMTKISPSTPRKDYKIANEVKEQLIQKILDQNLMDEEAIRSNIAEKNTISILAKGKNITLSGKIKGSQEERIIIAYLKEAAEEVEGVKVIKTEVFLIKPDVYVIIPFVPDIIGKSQREAEEIIKNSGFKHKVEFHSSYKEEYQEKEGKVVRQSPEAGKQMRKDSEIRITVYNPPDVIPEFYFSISPKIAEPGQKVTGNITLDRAPTTAPEEFQIVQYYQFLKTPRKVSVPRGSKDTTFEILLPKDLTLLIDQDAEATVGVKQIRTMNEKKDAIHIQMLTEVESVSLSRNKVVGGEEVVATIRLNRPAIGDGNRVNIFAENNQDDIVRLESTRPVIPPGQTTGTLLIETRKPTEEISRLVPLSFKCNKKSVSASLVVCKYKIALIGLFEKPELQAGEGRISLDATKAHDFTVYAKLNYPAPYGGMTFELRKEGDHTDKIHIPETITISHGTDLNFFEATVDSASTEGEAYIYAFDEDETKHRFVLMFYKPAEIKEEPPGEVLPDLTVSSIRIGGAISEGALPQVVVEFKNNGGATITEDFKFRMKLDDWEEVYELKKPEIPPDGIKTRLYRILAIKPGENQFQISLDIDNNVAESDENNNEVTIPVVWDSPQVTSRMSDLEIVDISSQGDLVEGERQSLSMIVKNSGDRSPEKVNPDVSSSSIRIILWFKRQGEAEWNLFQEPHRDMITIRPDQTVSYSFSKDAINTLPAGEYRIRGIVDDWAQLKDKNFQNNVLEKEITIAPSPIRVKSFSPRRAGWGGKILLNISTGRDLKDPDRPVSLSVKFNDSEGVIHSIIETTSWQDYTLTVGVPEGATSGPISVSGYGVTGKSQSDIAIYGPPTITEISPQAASVGSTIIVRGSNFVPPGGGDGTAVFYACSRSSEDGCEIQLLSNRITETELQFEIPSDALSGPLTIKTAIAGQQFSVNSQIPLIILPKITSFFPSKGHEGDEIKIYGSNINPGSRVQFNGVEAEVLGPVGVVGKELIAKVPPGAATGKVQIIADEGQAESDNDFRVLTGPTISSVSPQKGPEGIIVTIEGQDLDLITSASILITRSGGSSSIITEIVGTPTKNSAQVRIPFGINEVGEVEISVYFPVHHSNRVTFEVTPKEDN
jgi:hypothetical protein